MDIFKIVGIGIIGTVIANLLRWEKSELWVFAVMSTGIIILICVMNALTEVVGTFTALIEKTGVNSNLFAELMKIIGIGYLTEYSASICEDTGCGSIAKKIQLAGKISIFILALPILSSIIDIIAKLVG